MKGISSASKFFLRNAHHTIPKRVATITVSFFLEDRNDDDHDGSTFPPFVSNRTKIKTHSALSALQFEKESLTMTSRGL